MYSLFGLGLLLGIQHALEADHVAAVAALTRRGVSVRQATAYGASWGVGHAITLLMFGGLALALDAQLSQELAKWLEFAVGVMLLALGLKVTISVVRDRVHIHAHHHDCGTYHIHMHSHGHEKQRQHGQSMHEHRHMKLRLRDLMQSMTVGIMHGLAGTAALIVFVTATSVDSKLFGIGYIVVFGLGSILGMAVLSIVVSCPATIIARKMPLFGEFIRLSMGLATITLGGFIVAANWI
ncbi:MAG: urease accessory protein [Rhodospirillales bacterium]|mgnify:CR=1 FL=1|jgi:ABC-type nickel/cobalt efflux system permease component RcnA|nr:urease accessory protein [Rhodospirillales bacterium]MBT4039837.1 urease accessory protein [Rhodospirillales bacterium]MBT4625983.1 urease accessory protein [Rhodospirillales bacterium]MBT5350597.1 urease accessory protein [Rhodospirillales bacterium]MBT5520325.1 urease accessory protein [Rhodospirillales bacterium]